ncbi:MAG TPA: hypothetical protein VGR53_03350 [Nitrososphaerales archaeon]|nr:hypothetical protein [Nitrososphaerales archaeon]
MKGAALAGLMTAALLVGVGIGYFASVYSRQADTTPSVLIGVSKQACDSEGLVICGQQLSDLVNNTASFVMAENGSNFTFQKSASGEYSGFNGNETQAGFVLYYYLSGQSPPGSGCTGVARVIQVSIPLINGYYAVSQMTTSRQPPVCTAPPT